MEVGRSLDLVVIGSGPGGYVAAIRAAQLKLRVAVVEKAELGGICANWGCIPTKALLHSAEVAWSIKQAADSGIMVTDSQIQFDKVIQRSRKVAANQNQGVGILFKKNHIQHIPGLAKIKEISSDGVVLDVSGQTLFAKNVIVATGARPKSIMGITPDREQVITYFEAMSLKERPLSLAIVGAGAIGVEFAYFYNAMGTKVTLFEAMPRILPAEDEEISDLLLRNFRKQGIEVVTGANLQRVTPGKGFVDVEVLSAKGLQQKQRFDKLLLSVGVTGNVEELGLEKIEAKVEKGFISVNDQYQILTNQGKPILHLYAIGDVIGPPMLAHKASAEGIACVERIAGVKEEKIRKVSYKAIPGATFCHPEVASVGLTEAKVKALGIDYLVGRFPFKASGKAQATSNTDGMVKTIVDKKTGEILGAHAIGGTASDMIATMGLAVSSELTSTELLHTVFAHPTYAEILKGSVESCYNEAIDL